MSLSIDPRSLIMVNINLIRKLVNGLFISILEENNRCLIYNLNKFSGGGSYDEVDSFKKGKWIELREKFYDGS